jgi:hypothetical protein
MGSRAKAGLSFEIPVHPPNLIRHDEEMGGCLGVRSIQNNSNNHTKYTRCVPWEQIQCGMGLRNGRLMHSGDSDTRAAKGEIRLSRVRR